MTLYHLGVVRLLRDAGTLQIATGIACDFGVRDGQFPTEFFTNGVAPQYECGETQPPQVIGDGVDADSESGFSMMLHRNILSFAAM